MVKSYDRYELGSCFGIVNSKTSNSIFLNSRNILTGNDESVSLWDIYVKEIKQRLTVPFVPPCYFFSYHVSYLCLNEKNRNIVAVGYINGSVRLFDLSKNKIVSTFQGHTSSIVRLKFNFDGSVLCSCSKDTNIILWDVINDKGIVKLEGHSNVVTDVDFLEMKKEVLNNFLSTNLLVSVSKDCLIKLWDINIQTCIQTIVDCEEEISCLVTNEKKNRLIVACNSFLKIYKIDLFSKTKDKFSNAKIYISYLATIKRNSICRIQNMKMVFLIDEHSNDKEEENDGLDLFLQNGENEMEKENKEELSENENLEFNVKEENEEDTERKKALQFLNNNLTNNAKICERTSYSLKDSNGMLLCCTNLKKIEFYKINSIKNQKKSERSKKKRYIEKLKKNKDKFVKELKKVAKFKGKNNTDYKNLKQKLDEVKKEIDIYTKYQIHTANDEIKYVFNYTCKYRLKDIDIYKKKENDIFIYVLTAFTANRINVFKVNLFELLYNKDTFHVKHVPVQKKNMKFDETEERGEQEEDKEEEKEEEDKSKEEEKEEEKKNESEEQIIEKHIYDYSKCFKEFCEINKGHNNAIDFMELSKNNELLVSICKKYVKIWNIKNFQNIITIEVEGCTSAFFCSDDEYLIISDELGYIYLYELKNIELKYTYKAHTNKIVNLFLKPDGYEFISVAEENYIKLFFLSKSCGSAIEDETDDDDDDNDEAVIKNKIKKKENLENKMTLRFKEMQCHHLSDKASVSMFSPDGRFIIIGYLNNIIEVLYADSLQIHLTLYGHSLPITCIDVSKDGKLLASGSSDKCLFIWNFEFGNINKRFHTNCEPLTQVKFFNTSNNVVSVSRDGYIKLWDAVKFECICTLDGSFGCLTSLVIEKDDNFFITAGTYKSIRYWKRSEDELLFLEEERDKELNLQIEQEAVRNDFAYPSGAEKNVLLNKATIKTIETIKSSEKLIEYIDIIDEEIVVLETYYKNIQAYKEAKRKNELPDFVHPPPKPAGKPELLNKNPYVFLIEVLSNIKNNILNEVIIALPFSYAYKLLNYIKMYLKSFYFFEKIQGSKKRFLSCGSFNYQIECSINIILTIINIYRNQFLFDNKFRFLLFELNVLITPHLKKIVDLCSFNQMTLNFLLNALDDEGIDFEEELLRAQEEVKKVAEEKRQKELQKLEKQKRDGGNVKSVQVAVSDANDENHEIPEENHIGSTEQSYHQVDGENVVNDSGIHRIENAKQNEVKNKKSISDRNLKTIANKSAKRKKGNYDKTKKKMKKVKI